MTPYIGLALPALTTLCLEDLRLEPWALTGLMTASRLRSLRLARVQWGNSCSEQGLPIVLCGLANISSITGLTSLELQGMQVVWWCCFCCCRQGATCTISTTMWLAVIE